jgi:hypothetical protein
MYSSWSEFTLNNYKLIDKKNLIIVNDIFMDKIKEIRNNIKFKKIKYEKENNIISNKTIQKLIDNKYVNKNLLDNIKDLDYSVSISWKNNGLENIIYIRTTKYKFTMIEKRLLILLNMLNHIQNRSKNTERIVIYCILSKLQKKINNNSVITTYNINSGYNWKVKSKLSLCIKNECKETNDRYIFIWREEEFEKVIFHELMHLFDLDHVNEDIIKKPENIKCKEYKLFEGITDFKAIIYNMIYLSYVKKIKIEMLIRYELTFIKNQAMYINNNLIINKVQDTDAYSYYILKYLIFDYFIRNNNKKLLNEILDQSINLKKLIDNININEYIGNNYIDFDSARMTLFELL